MDLDFYWAFLPMSFLICLVLTVIAIPAIIRIAFEKQLFDVPDYRKVHTGQVPRLGGVAFLPGIMIATFIVLGFANVMTEGLFPAGHTTEIMYGAAGAMFLSPQWRILDPLAAMAVSVFIAIVAWRLLMPSVQELLEVSLPDDEINAIEREISHPSPAVRERTKTATVPRKVFTSEESSVITERGHSLIEKSCPSP